MVIVMLSGSRRAGKLKNHVVIQLNIFCLLLFLGCNGRAIPAETWKFNYKKCSFLRLVCTKYEMFVEWLSWLRIISFVFQSMPMQYLWAISFLFCAIVVFFLSLVKCSRWYLFLFCGWKFKRIFHLDALQQSQKISDFNVPRGNCGCYGEYTHRSWLEILENHKELFSKSQALKTRFERLNIQVLQRNGFAMYALEVESIWNKF